MEILQALERNISWRREGSSAMIFRSTPLDRIVAYITNPNNASVVFSNGFYSLEGVFGQNGESQISADLLRRQGAKFRCVGTLHQPMEAPLEIGFEVTTFDPQRRIKVRSTNIVVGGRDFPADLEAGWRFQVREAGVEALLTVAYIPHGLLAHSIGRLVPQNVIDREVDKMVNRIAEGILRER